MELWAHCATCTQWFFVPSDTIEAMATTRCPVCSHEPVRFEERGHGAAFECTLERVGS